jgi:hypothetical protein
VESPAGLLHWVYPSPLREMEWAPPQTGSTQSLAEPAPGEEPEYGPLE